MFFAKVFALDTACRYHGIASQSCRAESVLFALAESGPRMASDSRRLSILTAREVDDLYGLPRFTEDDRDLYFDLSPAERELVDCVFTISVAVHLVLQLGYFKAKRQFFVFALDAVTEDAVHILRRYFPARDMVEIKSPSRSTRLEQQQAFSSCSTTASVMPPQRRTLGGRRSGSRCCRRSRYSFCARCCST